MKKIKPNKLSLNKQTVTNLNDVIGGKADTSGATTYSILVCDTVTKVQTCYIGICGTTQYFTCKQPSGQVYCVTVGYV